jgi:hypothetical protein
MKRIVIVVASLLLAFGILVPVAAAADPQLPHTGRVIVSVQGDAVLPAGEHADVVVVVGGDATIMGEVNTLVVVDGTATLTGATVEDLVVVRGSAMLHEGTRVLGDARTLDASIQLMGGSVLGEVRGLEADFANFGLVLGPALILLYVGFALSTIAAALLLVALGTRQVRAATVLVQRELGMTLLWGLAALFLVPILAVLFMLTVVGAPLGVGLLLVAWPALAFVGYLFAGVMLGDWLVTRMRGVASERPYLGAVVGLLLLQVFGLFPPVTFIASFVGMGAVLNLAWRTFRGTPRAAAAVAPQPPTGLAEPA